MLRKALILGMVFILALSLLAVSMITCFTYDAEADVLNGGHGHYTCENTKTKVVKTGLHDPKNGANWVCCWYTQ